MVVTGMLDGRIKAVKALRTNPKGYVQITKGFSDTGCGRCAMGLIFEEFNISMDDEVNVDKMCRLLKTLGMYEEYEPVSSTEVYDWNDRERLSYSQIADRLSKAWGLDE